MTQNGIKYPSTYSWNAAGKRFESFMRSHTAETSCVCAICHLPLLLLLLALSTRATARGRHLSSYLSRLPTRVRNRGDPIAGVQRESPPRHHHCRSGAPVACAGRAGNAGPTCDPDRGRSAARHGRRGRPRCSGDVAHLCRSSWHDALPLVRVEI